MPKVKCSNSVKLRGFIKEFGDKYFSTDGEILFCKMCEVKVTADKRFTVQQHCNTAKHRSCVNREITTESRQRLLFEKSSSSSPKSGNASEFSKDLCTMMVSSNIPLHKVDTPSFRNFLEKYTTHPIPTESTLRKNYLTSCYDVTINKIRNCVGNNKIWVSIDETTDVSGRFVANVVVGILKDDQPGDIFLLACEVLEKVNNSSIAVVFDNAMNLLWPNKVERENVLLFLTDAAPYMVKAAKGLQVLYPKMIHATCLAHALHRVAEEVRESYSDVDKLIANGKKIFVKAPLRLQKFKEEAPSLPLPPKPILTRWGTWLDAADYYCTHYSVIENIFNKFDRDDSSSIRTVQDLFSSTTSRNLAYIKSNFSVISKSIIRLEAVGMQLCNALEIVKKVESELHQAQGEVAVKICAKLQNVLQRNPGYSTLRTISDILCGKEVEFDNSELELDASDLTCFKYAPVTSCDVERSFSKYKAIVSDNRRSFKFENLKMHVVIQCNSTEKED